MNTPALLGLNKANEQEYFCMKRKDFEWLTDEFMLYCRSTQLREKTMSSYAQSPILQSIIFLQKSGST